MRSQKNTQLIKKDNLKSFRKNKKDKFKIGRKMIYLNSTSQ